MSGARGSGRGPRGGGPAGARGGRPAAAPTTIRGPAAGTPATATSIRGPPTSSASASANRPTPPITSGPSSSRSTPIASTSTTNFSGATTGIIGHKDKSGRIVDLISPDDRCPNCKTDRYLNPRLKLLVSPCYHKLCTSCIDRIWALGPAPCPACGHVCRKSQFGSQTFSDLEVEREVDVRKRVGRLFAARRAEDFASLKEYNDWLEEAEQLTFNLVNRIGVEETNAKLAQYERSIAAAKNANNNDDVTAAAEALDARLQQLRQARIARRKAQDLEDAALRREEEKAVVAALEEGQEEEELAVIQAEWHEKRLEVERRREEQEAGDVRVEEEVRREIAEAQSGVRKAKARGGVGGAGEETRRPEWKAESLLQFAPAPMARLSVGDELLEPAISKVCAPVELRAASSANATGSWTPYDPWIEPFLDHLDDAKRTTFKAGGYDVAEWWRYQMRTGVGSLGVDVQAGGAAASS